MGPSRHRRHRVLPQGPAVRPARARPASRTRRWSSSRSRARGRLTGRPAGAGRSTRWTRSPGCSARAGSPGARRRPDRDALAGARRGASVRRRSTGGRPVVAVVGALAFGLLPIRFGGRRARGRPLRRVVRDAGQSAARDGPRPAAAAGRPDAADHPDRARLCAERAGTRWSATSSVLAIVAAVVIPAVLFVLSIPFGAGAIGIGDIKLLVSVGLLAGGEPGARRRRLRARPGRASSSSRSSRRAGSGARSTSRSGRSSSSAPLGRAASDLNLGPGAPGPSVGRQLAHAAVDFTRIMPRSRCRPGTCHSDGDSPAGVTVVDRAVEANTE